MIKIENGEFFGFDKEVIDEYMLINLIIKPEEFDLNRYHKTPFCTIVIHDSTNKFGGILYTEPNFSKSDTIHKIIEISSHYNVKPLNLYLDVAEYDDIKSKFECTVFHTIIYYIDMDNEFANYETILVGGFPIRGILSPIKKSPNYTLYNGKFISCKMFKTSSGDFCNGIVYILADIYSTFRLEEYRYDSGEYGYLVIRDWMFDLNPKDETIRLDSHLYSSIVPYEGREKLFIKTGKNLFHLSDVPNNVQMKYNSVETKLV